MSSVTKANVVVDHGSSQIMSEEEDESKEQSWHKVAHNCLDTRSKRDDLSLSQAESMLSIRDSEEVSEPLANIYAYLSECLDGKRPRELNLEESAIVVSLLQEVKSAVMQHENTDEKDFLSKGSWWTSSHESDGESSTTGKQTSSHPMQQSLSSCANGDISGSAFLDNYLTTCLSFPKIKRIGHCLNPLQVPVSLMTEEQKRLFPEKDIHHAHDHS